MFDIEVPQKPKVRTTFMQAYVANMVEYLRLKHPEKTVDELNSFYGDGQKILIDLKGLLSKAAFENAGYYYWRL